MEPEPEPPEPIDMSALDPRRDPRWDATVARVAARGRELRRLRRAVVRRGMVAVAVAAAAAIALWISVPRRAPVEVPRRDLLDWATHDVSPGDVLELGGAYAH